MKKNVSRDEKFKAIQSKMPGIQGLINSNGFDCPAHSALCELMEFDFEDSLFFVNKFFSILAVLLRDPITLDLIKNPVKVMWMRERLGGIEVIKGLCDKESFDQIKSVEDVIEPVVVNYPELSIVIIAFQDFDDDLRGLLEGVNEFSLDSFVGKVRKNIFPDELGATGRGILTKGKNREIPKPLALDFEWFNEKGTPVKSPVSPAEPADGVAIINDGAASALASALASGCPSPTF
jgi:Fe-S-cluster formation regulator IscX/YfhJ